MMQSAETMAKTSETKRVDPQAAWTAVLARDRHYDGRFVYAVRSTGIFCRPSCPSRRPHRRHVAFYDGPASARAAGFRACRRCTPETMSAAALAIERVRAHIDARLDERLTLAELARVAGLSPSHLQKAWKAALGLSPRDYVRLRRAERFKAEVRSGRSVTDALYEAGYGSGSRLYSDANARLGMTPGAYKRGGAGETSAFRRPRRSSAACWSRRPSGGCAPSSSASPTRRSRRRSARTTRAPSSYVTIAC
jgi:AraC family transcriptional regulator of adaptative response/methylated-DNA-[protein]-cysteine methyltransferase